MAFSHISTRLQSECESQQKLTPSCWTWLEHLFLRSLTGRPIPQVFLSDTTFPGWARYSLLSLECAAPTVKNISPFTKHFILNLVYNRFFSRGGCRRLGSKLPPSICLAMLALFQHCQLTLLMRMTVLQQHETPLWTLSCHCTTRILWTQKLSLNYKMMPSLFPRITDITWCMLILLAATESCTM